METDVCWFPMRVTYNREMKVKERLDQRGVECFLPMCYCLEGEGIRSQGKLVPAIHNLIFVHSSREEITKLKMHDKGFESLRYLVRRNMDKGEIITVRDKDMDNFIKVASVADNSIFYIDHNNISACIGKKVRITAGRFKDVIGVVKRIKRNRHVVIYIEGIAAVAITYIPAEFIEEVI